MRTNSKEVQQKIRNHIRQYMSLKLLNDNMNAVLGMHNTPTTYHAVAYLVDGGSFLIYYSDVAKFLNRLGINSNNKNYSNNKSWNLYKHLIASNGEKMINEKYNNSEKSN